ncbi:MAG TPA: hypothetical protein EYG72_00210 [Candidatus Pacebacteria bacterium]|nr:hypothetical protein [Candidatus Paceibacterota bacterium]
MEKSDFSKLINKAKSVNKVIVIQKVTPVIIKQNEETQFSFYIEKGLLKKVKFKALEDDVSVKSIFNTAIEYYLEKGEK